MRDTVIKNACPHCGGKWRTESRPADDGFSATIYYQCTNFACSWSTVGTMTLTHETSPSKLENATATKSLPPAQAWIRKQRAQG
jgi:hypothetical protein